MVAPETGDWPPCTLPLRAALGVSLAGVEDAVITGLPAQPARTTTLENNAIAWRTRITEPLKSIAVKSCAALSRAPTPLWPTRRHRPPAPALPSDPPASHRSPSARAGEARREI